MLSFLSVQRQKSAVSDMWVFAFTSSTAVLGARYTYGVIVSKSDICFDESKEKEYVISFWFQNQDCSLEARLRLHERFCTAHVEVLSDDFRTDMPR